MHSSYYSGWLEKEMTACITSTNYRPWTSLDIIFSNKQEWVQLLGQAQLYGGIRYHHIFFLRVKTLYKHLNILATWIHVWGMIMGPQTEWMRTLLGSSHAFQHTLRSYNLTVHSGHAQSVAKMVIIDRWPLYTELVQCIEFIMVVIGSGHNGRNWYPSTLNEKIFTSLWQCHIIFHNRKCVSQWQVATVEALLGLA